MKNQKLKAQLFYKDKIYNLFLSGKSVRQITDYINKQCLTRSHYYKNITLSKSTIHNIITKMKEANNGY